MPTLGLHSSSKDASSYSYLAFGSAFFCLTASSAELRPPSPICEPPPERFAIYAILTFSFANAGPSQRLSSATTAKLLARLNIEALHIERLLIHPLISLLSNFAKLYLSAFRPHLLRH